MSREWVLPQEDPSLRESLSRALGISPLTAQLLINRGIQDPEAARAFLDPDPSHLHDPFLLADMDRATSRLIQALERGERIVLYGDYDVDGVSATALLYTFFQSLGVRVGVHLPDRLREGYGLRMEVLQRLREEGATVVITVDCGTAALEEIETARGLGLDVIVTDHHTLPTCTPRACALINPRRTDQSYPFPGLSGVGVALKLVHALYVRLQGGPGKGFPEALEPYLDLVALGTIADLMPVQGENRYLLRKGLECLSRTPRPGIAALREVAGLRSPGLTTEHVAFVVAPRLNAAGRLSSAGEALALLLAQEADEAWSLAQRLDQLNRQRQQLEDRMLREARERVEQEAMARCGALVLGALGWHPGIVGIVAARLVEEYQLPVVLIAVDDQGYGRGSARGVPGLHLVEALRACGDLLDRFGGHEAAAGLSLRAWRIPAFRERFAHVVRSRWGMGGAERIPLRADLEVPLQEVTFSVLQELARLAPFGPSNPPPVLVSRGLEVLDPQWGERGTLRMRVRQGRTTLHTVGFRLTRRHQEVVQLPGQRVDLAYTPGLEYKHGTYGIQLRVRDLRRSPRKDA